MTNIPVGTMVRANGGKGLRRLRELLPLGFECYQYHWWAGIYDENLKELAARTREQLRSVEADSVRPGNQPESNVVQDISRKPFISSLALYGNPLRNDNEGEEARNSLHKLIQHASDFNCRLVGCFTGRIPGTPWEESLPVFTRVFGELCREAADHGVKIAFENCPMDGNRVSGDWNLAFNPWCWEHLLNALPASCNEVIGLEWEPAHQILQGEQVILQLKTWVSRVFHIHGKDARIQDAGAPTPTAATDGRAPEGRQTLPGNGDSNWIDIMTILNKADYTGTIDIEGYHDADWAGSRELEGQKNALEYLRRCRDKR